MNYKEAYSRLLQALRKAPDQTAMGFKNSVYKVLIICELFIGEIPQRQLFSNPLFKKQ